MPIVHLPLFPFCYSYDSFLSLPYFLSFLIGIFPYRFSQLPVHDHTTENGFIIHCNHWESNCVKLNRCDIMNRLSFDKKDKDTYMQDFFESVNKINGIFLLIPFLFIRFGLLSALSKKSIYRASHFAPLLGNEKIAYYIYQISNIGIFLYPIFLTIKIDFSWQFYVGTICYILGLCLCSITIINFSSPDYTGLNTNGIYRLSRNPMYMSYFICFIGMALLVQSLILLGMVLIFQISAHWIILSEERWCIEEFGEAYIQYMKKVRRYI